MKKRQRWIGVMVAGLMGCGGGAASETPSDSTESGGETASVSSSTTTAAGLRGTVGGQAWEARSALAGHSITEEADRNVALYPFVISCAEIAEGRWPAEEAEAGTRDVAVTVTYTDGFTASPPDGTFERSRISENGTVTVVRAGERGLLRLDMQGEDPASDSISGEIEVIDCGSNTTVRGPAPDRGTRLALAR